MQDWRKVFAELPDRRTGENARLAMADIALSAFAVFFTQCPSFLSFQQNMEKSSGRNNARSLFLVEQIPCDNHIRQTLDPVEARHLFCLFDDLHQTFDKSGLLRAMRSVGETRLIALDGTWYFPASPKTSIVPTVLPSVTPRATRLISTAPSRRSLSARTTPRSCRCARSSSPHRTGGLNRTARSTRPSAG